jgi:hypothetical protein
MGFFDDLQMGLGLKEKTDDYKERTANTIARTRGNAAADKYRSDVGISGSPQPKSTTMGPPQTTIRPRSRPQPQTGYTSIRDMFDGGGPGRSGARFSSRDTGAYDTNNDGYVSEAEYSAAERNFSNFNDTQGGIAALSNFSGARPSGSYARERNLGPQGTNIGTSGLANYAAGAGALGGILRGGRPNRMMMANPNMPRGAMFTPENVQQYSANPVYGQSPLRNLPLGLGPGIDMLASGAAFSDDPQKRFNSLLQRGYTPEQAAEYLRKTDQNLGKPPTDYSQYGTQPTKPLSPIPVGMNMGGLMALRDYNMGMQMGMGQSV